MKKMLLLYTLLIAGFMIFLYFFYFRSLTADSGLPPDERLQGTMEEKYVMVTFQSGIDYWRTGLKGFEDAAQVLGVSVEYRGATQYDINEQITVLEQVIARKPAGIALSAMDPEALVPTIDKAVEAGIPVVLFDSGAPSSRAYSFLGTDNYNAGEAAAHKMAELIGQRGAVAVVTRPGQLNHQERTAGFRSVIDSEYPEIDIVAVTDGEGDQLESEEVARSLLAEYPELVGVFATEANGGVGVGRAVKSAGMLPQVRIISFDTDKGTLDMVKEGTIAATLAQGTWNMGYWALMHLFHLEHDIAQPGAERKSSRVPPLPVYVDTGISIVTQGSVDDYYAK
ncbi:sugar ABC transporter substrate-binding protein [Paenibacillus sambharensis]|uniref:Sugar ABC transporter substrate-binding protein n=1 Tax=Paenibacillus sambharensis TaxID=1803190 RepID=A0A2W1LH91_9BACL|nr:substrate-binding domain-containing protein [Paenibacillus sambharensis]PZD94412.1 sugar ABC transporter substrate-binding protein [Paenibacillus sambharensis]